MTEKPLFYDRQNWFSQWWIWVILVGLNAMSWYAAYQQLVLEQPFGNNPMSDTGLFALIGFVTLFSLFFLFMRLETEINKEGIYVRFYPFHLQYRFFSWDEMKEVHVRKYSPIMEYGGWGLRYSFSKGRAWNMSGNMGLQIVLKGGKKLLIGTRKPSELEEVLKQLHKTT